MKVNARKEVGHKANRGRHKLDQVIKLFDLGSSYQNFDPRTEINFFFLYRFDNLILDQKYFFEKLIS